MTNKYLTTLNIIKHLTRNILIKHDVDGYRPIKNTSKNDCYMVLYEIIEVLKRADTGHGGYTHD